MQIETQLCSSTEADCNAALKINPDSGKAYRVRGKACVCCSISRLIKAAAFKSVEGGQYPAATEIDQYTCKFGMLKSRRPKQNKTRKFSLACSISPLLGGLGWS